MSHDSLKLPVQSDMKLLGKIKCSGKLQVPGGWSSSNIYITCAGVRQSEFNLQNDVGFGRRLSYKSY